MTRSLLCLIAALLFGASASGAGAEPVWTLTTADFQTQPVALKAIGSNGVTIVPAGGGDSAVVPFDRFLDVTRSLPASATTGTFTLYLSGADHVCGEPLGLKGNDLLWNSPTLGQIALPMKQLVAMTRPGVSPPDARRADDLVTLANGDLLHGIIADIAGGKVTVQTDGGASSVPIGSINQINFAMTAGGAGPATVGFRLRLDDGSSVIGKTVALANDKIDLALQSGAHDALELTHIAAIEQINGPVSWLSLRPTSENLYIPFIGAPRTNAAQMDRNWGGQGPIRFGSQEFAHGIGVHSYSRLSWDLDGAYIAFRTRYAIDTRDANPRADVTVRILLDGKAAYEQAHVRAGTLSPVVVKDLDAAKKLTLEVDYGSNADYQARAVWLDPALVGKKK